MPPEQAQREQAAAWLSYAAKDLESAALLVQQVPSNAAYHCQQAAEKAAKGFLALHDVPFRKTHNLDELRAQCAEIDAGVGELLAEADDLTDYASAFRYPDAPYEPDEHEAARALAIAQRVYDRVKSLVDGQ